MDHTEVFECLICPPTDLYPEKYVVLHATERALVNVVIIPTALEICANVCLCVQCSIEGDSCVSVCAGNAVW